MLDSINTYPPDIQFRHCLDGNRLEAEARRASHASSGWQKKDGDSRERLPPLG
jgi:hypothetical protein